MFGAMSITLEKQSVHGDDPAAPVGPEIAQTVAAVLRRYWGYDTLRPLQHDAIAAGIAGRDSVVILPTGGGKSLCYQITPMVANRIDVVVSPLISLMKDQVDGLTESGYPAVALHRALASPPCARLKRPFERDATSWSSSRRSAC